MLGVPHVPLGGSVQTILFSSPFDFLTYLKNEVHNLPNLVAGNSFDNR